MRLAYTTVTDTFFFDLDIANLAEFVDEIKETMVFSSAPKQGDGCYGIARFKNTYVLGKRIANKNAEARSSLLVYDLAWNFLKEIPVKGCKQLHQITPWQDKMLCASTGTNEIFVTDMNTGKSTSSHLSINKPIAETKTDENHINSMCIHGDSIYLYCHNHCNSMIVDVELSSVLSADKMRINRTYEYVGMQGHNVMILGNRLLSLNSGHGMLMCHGLKTGCELQTVALDGRYLRGLEATSNHIFIGGSYVAKDRTERFANKDIVIYVLEKTSLEIVSRIGLAGKKNILDIRVTK